MKTCTNISAFTGIHPWSNRSLLQRDFFRLKLGFAGFSLFSLSLTSPMWLFSMTPMYDSHLMLVTTLSIGKGNRCQRYLKISPVSPDSRATKSSCCLKSNASNSMLVHFSSDQGDLVGSPWHCYYKYHLLISEQPWNVCQFRCRLREKYSSEYWRGIRTSSPLTVTHIALTKSVQVHGTSCSKGMGIYKNMEI